MRHDDAPARLAALTTATAAPAAVVPLERPLLGGRDPSALRALAEKVGHDLRNPLAAVLGHGELALLLLEQEDVEAARASLTQLLDEAQRQQRMIDEIVDLVRGVPVLRRRPVTAADFFEEEVAPLARRLASRSVTVVVRASLPAGARIEIDPGRCLRAVENLLLDARDAVHALPRDAPRRIVVTARACGGEIRIRVADSAPARRAGPADPAAALRLPSARAVALAHGGGLEVEVAGGGARTFRVPGLAGGPPPDPATGEG